MLAFLGFATDTLDFPGIIPPYLPKQLDAVAALLLSHVHVPPRLGNDDAITSLGLGAI